jgi:hypothetical protein
MYLSEDRVHCAVQVATEEDILVFTLEFCVTYTVMGIMCVVVVTRMSSDISFPINESALAPLMNIYCLHQEFIVIRKWSL